MVSIQPAQRKPIDGFRCRWPWQSRPASQRREAGAIGDPRQLARLSPWMPVPLSASRSGWTGRCHRRRTQQSSTDYEGSTASSSAAGEPPLPGPRAANDPDRASSSVVLLTRCRHNLRRSAVRTPAYANNAKVHAKPVNIGSSRISTLLPQKRPYVIG